MKDGRALDHARADYTVPAALNKLARFLRPALPAALSGVGQVQRRVPPGGGKGFD